jgi:5-(carboxyamino)imidazole ribonucleotide synthase
MSQNRPTHHVLPRLGIIGGGQLALMLAREASKLGIAVRALESSRDCPTGREVADLIVGNWNDLETLREFARGADVITLENEFVSGHLLAALEKDGHIVLPGSDTISCVQDKLLQKRRLQQENIRVVEFLEVASDADLNIAVETLGFPFVLKRRCLGYDGTGNATVTSQTDIPAALARLGGIAAGLYAERWCPYAGELAMMVTRGRDGTHVGYPVTETRQNNHVCEIVLAPAPVSAQVSEKAATLALHAVQAVNGIGSFGVEMFLMQDGDILVNELAPRVHNSGHYTIEACDCSQFENHIRAVMGLPLGSTRMRSPAAMVNLLATVNGSGEPVGLNHALKVPGATVHLYGKQTAKPGRKMGHVTALGGTVAEALELARKAADSIRFTQPLTA